MSQEIYIIKEAGIVTCAYYNLNQAREDAGGDEVEFEIVPLYGCLINPKCKEQDCCVSFDGTCSYIRNNPA
jgi:hypothetical protein